MNNKDKAKLLTLLAVLNIMVNGLTLPASAKTAESNNSVSLSDNVYNTSDYYLIRINGNLYLTTRKAERDNYNSIYKYYDVRNGRFIGQTLSPYAEHKGISSGSYRVRNNIGKSTGKRSLTSDISTWAMANVYALNLFDENYFDGKYGLGYNLPSTAVIPISEIMPYTSTLSQEEFQYFKSNSSTLKKEIEEEVKFTSTFIPNEFIDFNFWTGYPDRVANTRQDIEKAECTRTDGKIEYLFGFRCSYFSSDSGYNQFYDITSGRIYNLNDPKYSDVVVSNWSWGYYTVADLKEKVAKLQEDRKTVVTYYSPEKLFVLSPKNSNVTFTYCREYINHRAIEKNPDTLNNNYILYYRNKLMGHDTYKDPLNKKAFWWNFGYSSTVLDYSDYELESGNGTSFRIYSPSEILQPLDEYLISIGREDLIKPNGYTEEDLTKIYNLINTLSNGRRISFTGKRQS